MRIIFLSFFIVVNLFAHKLNLFLELENEELYVYSYFASGSPCKDCKLEFYDVNNKLLNQVKTNSEGEYYLKDYEKVVDVRVEALGGHAIKQKFNLNDYKKNNKKEEVKTKTSQESYLQSFIAIVVLVLIFVFLKRVKK